MNKKASYLRKAKGRRSLARSFYRVKVFGLVLISFLLMSMIHGQTLHLEGANMSLKTVFDEIKKQSGFTVFVRKDILNEADPVNFDGRAMTVKEILDHAVGMQGISYRIQGKEIILTKVYSGENTRNKNQSHHHHHHENILIGQVLNSQGKPISDATVRASRSGIVTRTNDHGQFMIKIEIPDQLTVSMLGYESKTLALQNASPVKVVLQLKSVKIDDVVVNGIFSRPKENFTGSATSIKGEELRKVSPTNVFKAISAFEPSFQVVANNIAGGNINQVPNIQLRGQNSFPNLSGEISQNPNQPLFF